MGSALSTDEDDFPGRDVPCRGCRRMVPMTGAAVGYAAIVAEHFRKQGWAALQSAEVMLCEDCDRALKHRDAVKFEAFRQDFVPRVRECKERGSITEADRAWFLANDCARTIEGLEERFARTGEKTARTNTKRADVGAGFGKRKP